MSIFKHGGTIRTAGRETSLEDGPTAEFVDLTGRTEARHPSHWLPPTDSRRFADRDGLAVSLDGQLHNGDELRSLLGDPHLASDANLVHALVAKRGPEFLGKLVGDFSVVVWDRPARKLYLARDPFGSRPLFYSSRGDSIWWSSELEFLVNSLGLGLSDIDEHYITMFLVALEEGVTSPYKQVKNVPPGTIVTIAAGSTHTHTFWSAQALAWSANVCADREAEEGFLHFFRQSIECRLRSVDRAAAELSGGLDSSSIVCVADGITGSADLIETISFLYDGSKRADERTYMAAVETQRGKDTHFISDNAVLASFPGDHAVYSPNPHHAFASTFQQLERKLESLGASLLLTGHGGDHVLMNEWDHFPHLADRFLKGEFRYVHNFLKSWCFARRVHYPGLAWRSVVWPLLPDSWRARNSLVDMTAPVWMPPSYISRHGVRERMTHAHGRQTGESAGDFRRRVAVKHAASYTSCCYYRERADIDITYPFLDTRLVEFLSSLPAEQFARDGQLRSVQRRALENVLPEKIRKRRTKRGPAETLQRAFREQRSRIRQLCSNSCVCDLGIVDGERLAAFLTQVERGMDDSVSSAIRLWSVELWLRSLDGNAKAREVGRAS
jgi:asparagine synthase (glutamine-hydrolysing)